MSKREMLEAILEGLNKMGATVKEILERLDHINKKIEKLEVGTEKV
ncbi:hypothetical protein [Paenibacillus whitsoniae]|nr:hypothetical protein [Paenibacillus whitsoniae]